jgi:hypothetical protein
VPAPAQPAAVGRHTGASEPGHGPSFASTGAEAHAGSRSTARRVQNCVGPSSRARVLAPYALGWYVPRQRARVARSLTDTVRALCGAGDLGALRADFRAALTAPPLGGRATP